jgi:hypothetical protein
MTNSTNYVQQLPGTLNLEMVDDNDLVFSLNWNMDITDYVFEANIVPKNCETEIPMTVEIIDEVAGKVNVIITATSLADITPNTHSWYMNWTTPAPEEYIRTVLAGALVLRSR